MEIPNAVVLWTFGGLSGNLRSMNNYQNNMGYNLLCKSNGKYLIWETGQLSVNLGFDSKSQSKFHFHLPDGQEREILTGEPVAMAIGLGEQYLYYGKQTIGINLKWSKEPSHQWMIFGASGEKGEPIPTGTPCALLNQKVEPAADFLVHMEKHAPKVVDIGWTTSPDWLKDLEHQAMEAAVKAAIAAIL